MTKAIASDEGFCDRYLASWTEATRKLGGMPQTGSFDAVVRAGDTAQNPRRVYHTVAHFHEISEAAHTRLPGDSITFSELLTSKGLAALYPVVAAVMVRAGAHHDIVYHVDEDYACAGLLRDERYRILPPKSVDAPHSDYAVTAATPEGDPGVVLEMARVLFDVHPRDILTQFNGKNEFLSAIYAGLQGLNEGMPLRYIMAEMMMIEATRPFEDKDRLMRLREQFAAANRLLPAASQLDTEEIDAFMLGSAQLANVDVLAFALDYKHFLAGSVALLHEAARHIHSVEDYFMQASNREAFFLSLRTKMQAGDAAIFHAFSAWPPQETLEAYEAQAAENIQKDILISRALKVATALSASVETQCGNGNLDEIPWRLSAGKQKIMGGFATMRDPAMTETALALRDCMINSPLLSFASYLLGHLSAEELEACAHRVGQQYQAHQERFTAAFATRKGAEELLGWVKERPGMQSLPTIITKALGYEA